MSDIFLDYYVLDQLDKQSKQPMVDIQNNIKALQQHVRLHPEDAILYNAEIFLQLNELEQLKKAEQAYKDKIWAVVLFLSLLTIPLFLVMCSN